jgi:hypothetical protein
VVRKNEENGNLLRSLRKIIQGTLSFGKSGAWCWDMDVPLHQKQNARVFSGKIHSLLKLKEA